MLSASGDIGITQSVFRNGVIPRVWQENVILNSYKGKEDASDRGDYRRLKLTDQVLKF